MAEIINIDTNKQINDKYSFKDFSGQDLSALPASEFNDTIIIGSCFSQEVLEKPYIMKNIFPQDITGVIFKRCNLDNVLVPAGNTLVSYQGMHNTNKRIQIQNDLLPWILDINNNIIKCLAEKRLIALGISTNPLDIPKTKLDESLIITEEKRLMELQK